MRRLFSLAAGALFLCGSPVLAAPEFAPSAKQAFEGFVGINPPRADVPLGALWIDGYGPTGEAAAADNVETVRSLNAISIDKNLQLAVSVGLLNLFGVDPRARDHYVARFNDLSIVRVKDVSKLIGPRGEPRIVEAIKAGSVTVSSDSELGLNGRSANVASQIEGSGTSGRTRTYSMEARDMFIAIRVATPELIEGREQELRVIDGAYARLGDFLVLLSSAHCASLPVARCSPRFGIAKVNTQTVSAVDSVALAADGTGTVRLPVPISDGLGGLFTSLVVHWIAPCSAEKHEGCRTKAVLSAHYLGTRLKDARDLKASKW